MCCTMRGNHDSVFTAIRWVRFPPSRKRMADLMRTPVTELMFQLSNLTQEARRGTRSQSRSAHPPGMQQYGRHFAFYFHGNFLPKGEGCLPHSLNGLLTSFFAFSVLPCLLPKASLGEPEQKVAGTWPVCPPRKAPSQKEGASH